jgi:hypothetical protein
MDLDALVPTRPSGSALSLPLAPAGFGPAAPHAPEAPRNPAEVLAMLMDFSGSVALAELLATPAPEGTAHPDAAVHADALRQGVSARLDGILPLALKPLIGRRAPANPPPHELLALIQTHAGEALPDDDAVQRIARDLGAPLQSALATSLRQTQSHIATLRWEIAHELRALGPRADRLERIDAALQRSIQTKLGELLDRMEYAASLTFERACRHACCALSAPITEAQLHAWTTADGWLARYRERCVRMTRALFGHLRRTLEGLLRAAMHAEVR